MPGTLFVVATPIGNLEDLTFRALRVLREVNLIAAEDTRRTAKLLSHYEIRKPLVSLREHNERRETPRLIRRLEGGESIALVSDAGTPGISDPGAELVRAARISSLPIVPIPGPSAVTAALSASGFPASRFQFLGFPPHSGTARDQWFEELAEHRETVVFYEAPHRMQTAIGHLAKLDPPRDVVIFGEMTKLHERSLQKTSSSLSFDDFNPAGEFVVVLGPLANRPELSVSLDKAVMLVGQLTSGIPLSTEDAVREAAQLVGVRDSRVANAVRRKTILAKRQSTQVP